ncbi:MAG: ketoacyl-ACP synthase III [Rhodospirillales bacterium]
MITVRAIASYVPEGFENNYDQAGRFGLDRDFIAEKIGVERVSRRAKGEETSDMCVRAFEALQAKTGLTTEGIDFLMVVTQNPDGAGLPQSSAVLHNKLDLSSDCASFDLSLACSGYVYGLSVATSFMETNGLKNGLLFTCDPYSKIINPQDKGTALLFGDAATVTHLTEGAGPNGAWRPHDFKFSTYGRHMNDVKVTDGHLDMDGVAIVMFTAGTVPGVVHKVLTDAGLTMEDIDLFLFHQGSKFIIDSLSKRLGAPREKVPMHIAQQGNTVSSSIPLMFETYMDDKAHNRLLLNGCGVGLSMGTCLITRIDPE